eukprot:m.201482 g.201482  ORF g.201482 m.201482 type:complete len:60 (-) comp18421_c0_seq1:513-692(-)
MHAPTESHAVQMTAPFQNCLLANDQLTASSARFNFATIASKDSMSTSKGSIQTQSVLFL